MSKRLGLQGHLLNSVALRMFLALRVIQHKLPWRPQEAVCGRRAPCLQARDPELPQTAPKARFPPLTGVGAEALQGNLFSLLAARP